MSIPNHLLEAKICNPDTCKLANTIPTEDDKSNMIAKLVCETADLQRNIEDLLKENNEWKLENIRLNNIINELEKWLNTIPKYFMDKRSLNNGVYIEQGMKKQIDLTLDKLKEIKESSNK